MRTKFAEWASILSLLLSFGVSVLGAWISNERMVFIGGVASIAIFLTAVAYFCYLIIVPIYRSLRAGHEGGTNIIAVFSEYRNSGGNEGIFETTKVIQSKVPYLTKFVYKFTWFGNKDPYDVGSRIQQAGKPIYSRDPSHGPSTIELFLSKPLLYNDSTVIHWSCRVDIADGKSPTFIGTTVSEPMDVIELSAVFTGGDPESRATAVVSRCRADDRNKNWENLHEVDFDKKTSSYRWWQPHPDVGWTYRLDYHARM